MGEGLLGYQVQVGKKMDMIREEGIGGQGRQMPTQAVSSSAVEQSVKRRIIPKAERPDVRTQHGPPSASVNKVLLAHSCTDSLKAAKSHVGKPGVPRTGSMAQDSGVQVDRKQP